MNLLLFEDLFHKYFKNTINKPVKDNTEICVFEIFNNIADASNSMKLVLSKNLQSLLQVELGDKPFYKEYITHILSKGLYENVVSGNPNNNFTDEYIHVDKTLDKPKLSLCLKNNDLLKELIDLSIHSQCIKPNSHWLAFSLAQKGSFSLYYFDFVSQKLLSECFVFMLSLSSNSEYTVFDRNCNFEGDLFTQLRKTKRKIFYYTHSRSKFDCSEKKKSANDFFRGGVKLYTTRLQKNIHERRIIFDNFVLCIDDDFWNISIDKNTWKLDFILSKHTAETLLEKCSLFDEYRGHF